MHEQPDLPVIQPGPGPNSMRVGDEIFVPFVTERTPTIDVQLPAGQWVDYWDEERVVSGSLAEHPAPLGQEPVFLRLGAIIPMEVDRDYTGHGTRESAGALTVLVYPSGTSTFRYNDDHNGVWSTFKSVSDGEKLTLSAEPAVKASLLYRVGRMATRPSSVKVNGQTVLVNQSGSLPEMDSEAEVNEAASSAWFYDPLARRLIVKVVS
jgi:alpha-glucosidase (family GH31 glycosyl hydrolase)